MSDYVVAAGRAIGRYFWAMARLPITVREGFVRNDQRQDELAAELEALRACVDKRLDSHSERIATLDGRLNGHINTARPSET